MSDNYGVNETNPIEGGSFHNSPYKNAKETVVWNDGRLSRITRLRMLSDPGFPCWDISYCFGVLKDGTVVEVQLPFHQLPKRGWQAEIVKYAKKDEIYAKGLGVFDAVSTLC